MVDLPQGWTVSNYGAVLSETHEKRGDREALPVLSVTKTRGPMLASERFGKALHGRDLSVYRVARRGTIVADPMLLWDGSIGMQEVVEIGIVSPDYRVYELGDHVAQEFMRFVVRDPRMLRYYQGAARGTNVRRNRISREDFLRIPLRLPSLAEQRKIAVILSSVDKVIEKTQAVIEQLQVVKKAMMQELLTRGLPGRHTRFKKTEIGEIPESWQLARVDSIGSVAYGLTVNPQRRAASKRRPYLTVANLQEDGFVLDQIKEIGFLDGDDERYACRLGDVLIVEGNANPQRLGRAAVWEEAIAGTLHQNHLIRVRPDLSRVSPAWLMLCINADRGRKQIESAAKTSSGLHTINSSVVNSLLVALPDLHGQQEIVEVLNAVDSRRLNEERALTAAREVKSALMSVLLTGELRVTPDEAAA